MGRAELRVGFSDSLIVSRPTATTATSSSYATALLAGADSFWVPDHLNNLFPRALWQEQYTGLAKIAPAADAFMEPWTMLGRLTARNRLGRMQLGIGVTDTGRRNPAVTAQAAATVHLLSRGRAILGIGPGEREGNEPYGVDWTRPVARFEEAMATIRALWDANGALVNRDSEFFPLRNAVFDVPPFRGTRPPIWIAAHGPRMLRAAGRYGDGFFPAFPHPPQEYARRLDIVRSAASDAGRDPDAIVPAMWFTIATGRTRDDVDEILNSNIAKAGGLLAPDEVYARHGARHPLGAGFSGAQDILPHAWDEDTALRLVGQVPPAVVREIILSGTPTEIVDRVAEWRDHGLRHVVIADLSQAGPKAKASAALATLQALRKLRKL
ncbi:LLM class flavin-dependent oxidoreductase [Mycolicibacterium baixiangningiae]|uniref:LLM class flavin-dependent oxidoreductase n=1 Tax=Mycolicibacterium baixiangningiae TaxID=2761578 RepID=UPI0018D15384